MKNRNKCFIGQFVIIIIISFFFIIIIIAVIIIAIISTIYLFIYLLRLTSFAIFIQTN